MAGAKVNSGGVISIKGVLGASASDGNNIVVVLERRGLVIKTTTAVLINRYRHKRCLRVVKLQIEQLVAVLLLLII